MAQELVSKNQLLQLLREDQTALMQRLRAIPAAEFEKGAYENGWNGRQILAHITGIEWTYPKLLDLARGGNKPKADAAKPAEPATKAAQGGIESYNDRTVARYADSSVAELIDMFEANRKTTIEAIEAADDDLFNVPVKTAGGINAPLGNALNYVAVLHVRGHVDDIANAASS